MNEWECVRVTQHRIGTSDAVSFFLIFSPPKTLCVAL